MMSGGNFNDNGYIYYQVNQFADELENAIQNNHKKNDYGYASEYNEEVIAYLKSKLPEIRKVSEIMRAIDYLYSGDHGEDSFIQIIKSLEKK
jgi:uncharacterized protein (DUF1015 family)